MIYYATKETLQRYKLKTPEQFESEMAPFVRAVVNRERGNRLFEWGCKLFYFDRRKCLQIMHFETKLVIFLVDLKVKDLEGGCGCTPPVGSVCRRFEYGASTKELLYCRSLGVF